MSDAAIRRVALVGCPNSGKSALFNALTGHRQKVANYPGVTVEKRSGMLAGSQEGPAIEMLDLPGTYSLSPRTPDEEITRDVLLGRQSGENAPDGILFVADALHPERSLSFFLELSRLGIPLLVAWNLVDLAADEGFRYDYEGLSADFGIRFFPTVAIRRKGVGPLIESIEAWDFRAAKFHGEAAPEARYLEAESLLSKRLTKSTAIGKTSRRTDLIDRFVLHPIWGPLILFVMLAFIFQSVFSWAGPLQDGIKAGLELVSEWLNGALPEGNLRDLAVNGILAGVGAVVVFLPQILILFLWILLLEDSGYMSRAAFLLDRWMGKVGLHGRAFLPLLSSHACAIPAILSTRAIEDPKDRLTTILIAPITACSARIPVYTLLISAFVPKREVWLGLELQGLVMLGLYVAGILGALSVGFLLRKTILRGPISALLLELPMYRMPSFRNLWTGLWERARVFLMNAGSIILALSVLLWFLASYPRTADGTSPPILESYAGRVGTSIEPYLRPIGFDWRISVSLIPGFAAREVMVGALATVHAIENKDEEATSEFLEGILPKEWGLATALSLLTWYVFAPQCLATVAVVRRETASWKWTGFFLVFLTVLAYVASFVVYRIALSFGAMGPLS